MSHSTKRSEHPQASSSGDSAFDYDTDRWWQYEAEMTTKSLRFVLAQIDTHGVCPVLQELADE